MVNKLIFEGPVNNLSMGNVSINILLELWKKKIDVLYLPIGNTDINNFNLPEEFKIWLQNSANRFLKEFDRNLPTLKNWHLNQSWHFPTNKRYLLTYHECDQATPEEVNICKNIDKVFFCGNYSPKIFSDYGVNASSFNLGFDNNSFYKTNNKPFEDNRIQWFLGGKAEKRKATWQILNLWARKFGKRVGESYKSGEQIHALNCCIINPFYDIKVQEQQIAQALNGQKYINIQFFPFLERERFNKTLNDSDIDLTGLALAESWNLPAFNMTCLGKWSIVLNAHGHKSWITRDNCISVNPNGKTENSDGIFFNKGLPFNQGNFFTWSEKDVENAMELAISKAKTPNIGGELLKELFTYEKTVDNILKEIES